MNTRNTLSVLTLGALLGVGSSLAAPPEPTGSATPELEEVIVTARKIQENLQDVPVAVNAIGSETVREMNVRLLQDVLNLTPGAMHYEYSKTEQTYTIRGVGSPAEGASGDSSVLLMEDGEVISRDFMRSATMYDVDRIEVLRGPQGTTYGRNAVGGVIHTINNRPRFDSEQSANLLVGNYNFYSIDGVLNYGFTDTTAGRLSVHYNQRDGYTTNIANGKDIDNEDTIAARAQLLITPTDALELIAKGTYENDDGGPPPRKTYNPKLPYNSPFTQYMEESKDPWKVNNTVDPRLGIDRTIWSLGLDATWALTGMNLISLTHYRHGHSHEGVDTWGSPDELVFSAPVINDADVFSQELRLEHAKADSKHEWVVGLFYLAEDSYRKEDRGLLTLVNGVRPPFASMEFDEEWNDTKSLGLFAGYQYDLSAKTALALGLRYTWDKKDFSVTHYGEGPLIPLIMDENPVIAHGLSHSWDQVTGKVSLTHHFTDESMAYVSVSTGYKSGGYGTTPASLEAAVTPYNEEDVTNYEIGAKAEWFDRRLRTNVAIFRMDHDNIQTQDFAPSGLVVYGNAGKAETHGIELELQAAVTDYFSIAGSYAHYSGEYLTKDLAHENFANMPEWTGNLSGIFEAPLSGGGLLRCRVDYRARSKIWHDKINDPQFGVQPAIDIIDAAIGYQSASGHWDIGLWGKNLTEEAEVTNINAQGFMSQRTVGYGPPRTYGMSFRISY